MGIDFKPLLALVLVLLVMGTISYAIVYSVGWLLVRLYRWLHKYSWFASTTQNLYKAIYDWLFTETPQEKALRKWWKRWWKNNKVSVETLGEFIVDIFLDPLFYGYALVVVVDRLRSLNALTVQYPQYSYFQILELNMNIDTNFYMIFLIIFTLWMFGKAWKHRQDIKDKRALTRRLESIASILKKMDNKLDALPGNSKEETEEKEE